MKISEIAFRFSSALRQLRCETNKYEIAYLQQYVRDEMFRAIKTKMPAQEYYMQTKHVIMETLGRKDIA